MAYVLWIILLYNLLSVLACLQIFMLTFSFTISWKKLQWFFSINADKLSALIEIKPLQICSEMPQNIGAFDQNHFYGLLLKLGTLHFH